MEIYEIFNRYKRTKTKKSRIEFLQTNATNGLRLILQSAFDERVRWHLPKGAPPDEIADSMEGVLPQKVNERNEVQQYKSLHETAKGILYCVVGGPKLRTMIATERHFMKMCREVHPKDKDVLIAAKDKELGTIVKGLTLEIVQEAFPGLIK